MSHESEHPVGQPIDRIILYIDADREPVAIRQGRDGVTLIEACVKSGLHADIPYVRVWKGSVCEAEFSQHNIVGVYFSEIREPRAPRDPLPDIDPDCASGVSIADHNGVSCISCYLPF